MVFVAVHPLLLEMVAERISPLGTYVSVTVHLVDRPPAEIAIDLAVPLTDYACPGDTVMLAASNRRLAAAAMAAAPDYECILRRSVREVDAPLAQEVADGGGLGLAVVGTDLSVEAVFAGANAITALLGGVLSRMDLPRVAP
jgi:hypothetical protein